jgi:hypothetical protein
VEGYLSVETGAHMLLRHKERQSARDKWRLSATAAGCLNTVPFHNDKVDRVSTMGFAVT